MCKVSIIIPVYNTEKYLGNCIDSALGQTLNSIEIVCVNDGSTDNSLTILQEYACKDERLKIISLGENKGQAYARNRGLEQAKGEYVYFLDSDDWIEAEAMELLYAKAAGNNLDCVVFEGTVQFEKKEMMLLTGGNFSKKKSYPDTYRGIELCEKFMENGEYSDSPCLLFLKKEFLDSKQILFREGMIHEDSLWVFQVFWNSERVEFFPKQLFVYNVRPNSTMTGANSLRSFCGKFTAAYYIWQTIGNYQSKVLELWISKLYAVLSLDKKYADLKSDEVKAELQNEELRIAYSVFCASRKLYATYGVFSDAFRECVRSYRDVYIYGAGEIARSVLAGVALEDIAIKGFLVSTKEGNPRTVEGHSVKTIDSFSCVDVEQTIIIIAVAKYYQQEVMETIKSTCGKVKCIAYDE